MAIFHPGWGGSDSVGNTRTRARGMFFTRNGAASWVVMPHQKFQFQTSMSPKVRILMINLKMRKDSVQMAPSLLNLHTGSRSRRLRLRKKGDWRVLTSARNPPVNDNTEFFEVNILDHAVFLAHPPSNDVNKGIGKNHLVDYPVAILIKYEKNLWNIQIQLRVVTLIVVIRLCSRSVLINAWNAYIGQHLSLLWQNTIV